MRSFTEAILAFPSDEIPAHMETRTVLSLVTVVMHVFLTALRQQLVVILGQQNYDLVFIQSAQFIGLQHSTVVVREDTVRESTRGPSVWGALTP